MAYEVKKQAAPAAAKSPKAPKGDAKGKTQAASKGQAPKPANYTPELQKLYKEQIIDRLMKKFQYKSIMQVPKLVKITINEGVGAATQDKKIIDVAITELSSVTGQKAVATYSKKDIANFKLRKHMPIGVMVT
ncbi:MAG: 50S ribosomal protein L5, partial [Bacteroidales bacterium]